MKGGTTMILGATRSNADKPHAEGGSDNAVWEQWDYPTTRPTSEAFVQLATGYYELRWVFNTRLAESFQIRITSTVCYGLPYYLDDLDVWVILDPIVDVSTSTIITIEA
jgi:hypothetical protein